MLRPFPAEGSPEEDLSVKQVYLAGAVRTVIGKFGGGLASLSAVSYTHLTLPTTPYV